MTTEDQRQYQKDWYQRNRESVIARTTEWGKKNKEKRTAATRAWQDRNPDAKLNSWLKRCYGITLEQYRAMEQAQGGVCRICKGPPIGKAKRLSVDHDHQTKRVRGLLCSKCNSLIGLAGDNPAVLTEAVAYLKA